MIMPRRSRYLSLALLFSLSQSARGEENRPTAPAKPVVVLFSSADNPKLRSFEGPAEEVRFFDLENFDWGQQYAAAEAVVVTGHSLPPNRYLNHSADRIAAAIARFAPDLVVADTCYGFSSPLLLALAAHGLSPVVVGPTDQLSPQGLFYGPDFFRPVSTTRRAQAVRRRSHASLMRWRLVAADLDEVLIEVRSWPPAELTQALVRVHPNLVKVPLGGTEATLLVPVEPERFNPIV